LMVAPALLELNILMVHMHMMIMVTAACVQVGEAAEARAPPNGGARCSP